MSNELYASKEDLAQVLGAVNKLTEIVAGNQKEESERTRLIKERDEKRKALAESYQEDDQKIIDEYEPRLKALSAEAEEKFHRTINSGGKKVGAIFGKLTKPARALKEGIASEL